MPQEIEDCVKAVGDQANNAYALCNWMRSEGKGYFAHGESFDAPAAIREFEEARRQKDSAGNIIIPNVEVFEAGNWQGEHYDLSDLNDMVRNFAEFSSGPNPLLEVPFVVGHEEDQSLLDNTGIPAAGWVVGLRRKGAKLFADVSQVFPQIADLVEGGAYKHVSAEVYPRDEPPEGVPAKGCMMRRLALLGGQLPHIKSLADLPRPVRLSEQSRHAPPRGRLQSLRRVWQNRSRTWACFAEVSMADNDLREAALGAILTAHPTLSREQIEGLEDEDLAKLAKGPGDNGEAGGTKLADPMLDPGAATEPGAPVVWPEGMDRNSVIDALASQGEDAAALQAMTDQDLLNLYNQRQGGMQYDEGGNTVVATPTPSPTATQPKKVTTTQQFSEAVRTEAAKLVRELTAGLQADVQRERKARQFAERQQRGKVIRAFCEQLVKDGRATPAETEFSKDDRPIGPIAVSLWHADGVRKFSDGKTALEQLMESWSKRPKVRHFGELVADPEQQAAGQMTGERRDYLLSQGPKGRALLAREADKKQTARLFAEAMAGAVKQVTTAR